MNAEKRSNFFIDLL